uniref:Uncharacterized protein n=1 Tax=Kalanchoe fedtschenkoi TaxID=63787 RepID=A0A7N0VH50_KALFE
MSKYKPCASWGPRANAAKLVHQSIVIHQRRSEVGIARYQAPNKPESRIRQLRVQKPRDEDIGSALVGEGAGGDEQEETMMGLGEPAGGAEGVDDGADVERVGGVAAEEAEAVKEAEGAIEVAVGGAETVNGFGPVGCCCCFVEGLRCAGGEECGLGLVPAEAR